MRRTPWVSRNAYESAWTWTTASASAHTMAGNDGGQVVLVAEARGACMTHTHTHATISPHGRNLIPSGGRSWRSNLAARCLRAVLVTQQTCPRPNTLCASPTRRDHCSRIGSLQRDHCAAGSLLRLALRLDVRRECVRSQLKRLGQLGRRGAQPPFRWEEEDGPPVRVLQLADVH